MSHRTESAKTPGGRHVLPVVVLAVALLALVLGACSSDDTNPVGGALVDVELEALADTLDVNDVLEYRGFPISDPDLSLAEHQVLYLGEQGGNASSILVRFDLDELQEMAQEREIPLEAFSVHDSVNVSIRMYIVQNFLLEDTAADSTVSRSDRFLWHSSFQVFEVDDDVDFAAFPGDEPATGALVNLYPSEIEEGRTSVEIDFDPALFEQWLVAGGTRTFLIREGEGSGPGLTGYASKNLRFGGSTLAPTADTATVGPIFKIELKQLDEFLNLEARNDVSTFHATSETPTSVSDGFILRTGLRSYPVLQFDFADLPEDAFINRATISVYNDTTRAWGTLTSLVVSEFDTDYLAAQGDTLTLDDLGNAVNAITIASNVDPRTENRLEFNVTTAVQRMINGAYSGSRAFLISPPEEFTPSYYLAGLGPEFYFNQFTFYGSGESEILRRPRMKITYSLVEPIGGAK